MQHGTFGGLGSGRDTYYAQGSDDFRTYVWKIPDGGELLENRKTIDFAEWQVGRRPGEIGELESLIIF